MYHLILNRKCEINQVFISLKNGCEQIQFIFTVALYVYVCTYKKPFEDVRVKQHPYNIL